MVDIKDQPNPKGIGNPVQKMVIKDIEDRLNLGIERYGEALKVFNGRNALIDLYQELIDAAIYIRQVIEEECLLHNQLKMLFNAIDSKDCDTIKDTMNRLREYVCDNKKSTQDFKIEVKYGSQK